MGVAKGTYYKALLLFLVFSLNTVVSFACSFGGMFHGLHHSNSSEPKVHDHEDKAHGHSAAHDLSMSNNSGHHDHQNNSDAPTEDDCCSKNLVEIEKVEKSVGRVIEAPNVPFITTFITAYSYLFYDISEGEIATYPQHIRWRSPATILDLRIVIQSFQI